jgi:hypothetical protein
MDKRKCKVKVHATNNTNPPDQPKYANEKVRASKALTPILVGSVKLAEEHYYHPLLVSDGMTSSTAFLFSPVPSLWSPPLEDCCAVVSPSKRNSSTLLSSHNHDNRADNKIPI